MASWGVWAALALVWSLPLAAQSGQDVQRTPAGTRIVNQASARTGDSTSVTVQSIPVEVTVGQVAETSLEPPRNAVAAPGSQLVLPHVLTNRGNGPDRFDLTVLPPVGWPFELRHDVDGDGLLSPADTVIADGIALDAGDDVDLLLILTVPGDAADGVVSVELQAASRLEAGATDSVTDTVSVSSSPPPPPQVPEVELTKVVDLDEVGPGGQLKYTLTATVVGAEADVMQVTDTLPATVRYLSGSVLLDGVDMTAEADDDAVTVDLDAGIVELTLRGTAPGARVLTFSVLVPDDAPIGTTLVNRASALVSANDVVVDEAQASADTEVVSAVDEGSFDLTLVKTVDRTTAAPGDTLSFSLTAEIAGDGLDTLTLVDALPTHLSLLPGSLTLNGTVVTAGDDADGMTYDPGTGTLTFAAVAPTAGTYMVRFQAVIAEDLTHGLVITNLASGTLVQSDARSVSATDRTETRIDTGGLRVAKSVSSTGPVATDETLTWQIHLTNTATTVTEALTVVDTVPDLVRVVSTTPAATVSQDGIVRWTVEPLGAGESRVLTVTVRVGPVAAPTEIRNRVHVRGEGVTTATATSLSTTLVPRRMDPVRVTLVKTVDRERVPAGGGLTYRLDVQASALAGLSTLTVVDTLPAALELEAGSLVFEGEAMTVAAGDDPVTYDADSRVLRVDVPAPQGERIYTLIFRARTDARAGENSTVVNRGWARATSASGDAAVALGDAMTTFDAPALAVTKTVAGPDPARLGDTLTYTIEVANPSSDVVRGLRVTDEVPSVLEILDTDPRPTSQSGNVVSWDLAALEPGATAVFRVRTRVGEVDDSTAVVNRARVDAGANGDEPLASSEGVTTTILPPEPQGPVVVEVEKTADRSVVAPGDVYTYRIDIGTQGRGRVDEVTVLDSLPREVSFVPQSLRVDGREPESLNAEMDITVEAGRVVQVQRYDMAAGSRFSITFEVRVGDDVPGGTEIRNRAQAESRTSDGSVLDAEDEAVTRVVLPEPLLTKTVLSQGPVTEGDTVRYRLSVRNPSTDLAARGLTVVDTLPRMLRLTGTTPELGAVGGNARTVVWPVGELAPGEERSLDVVTEVGPLPGPVDVVNVARLVRQATEIGRSTAVVAARPTAPASLALGLVAERLEVATGEVLPLTVSVENSGQVPISRLRVDIGFPRGAAWFDQEVRGVFRRLPGDAGASAASELSAGATLAGLVDTELAVDSVRVRGDSVSFWLPGTLAPREGFAFTYELEITARAGGKLRHGARVRGRRGDVTAEANAVEVASETAVASVTRRREAVLETRTVVGRVFVDADRDGRQDEGEPGVGGVEIWTEEGDVVTTDETGKYSLVNVRPGRHLLRVDPRSLPAGLRPAGDGVDAGVVYLETTGWTTGRADFALVGAESPASVVTPAPTPDSAAPRRPVLVPPARSPEAREKAAGNAFLTGPALAFFAPDDGRVTALSNIFIGVRGEAGTRIELVRGDSVVGEATIRPDGVWDFVGTELAVGPNLFVVRGTNSWGRVTTDSLRIHRSGAVESLVPETSTVRAVADGRTPARVRVRALDRWGVPVVAPVNVTVEVEGGSVAGTDADPGSVGMQVAVDDFGWADFAVVGGTQTGEGEVRVRHGDLRTRIDLEVVADVRPLLVTGAAQLTLGSGGASFGAVTARGRLDDETSLTLSYDSRSLDQDRDAFARVADPLEDGRYTMIGDASVQRAEVASRYRFYGKVERGLDWLVVGDLEEGWFTEGLGLARYSRAIPGVAARVTTGDVVWNAFGATTEQALRQAQFRGNGTSGPFELGGSLVPGTDRVTVEARAVENPTRVIGENTLRRFIDYQIDYERGVVLLKRPLPAQDPSGNPLFLVVGWEGNDGGDRSLLLGLRGSGDLSDALDTGSAALPVALQVVRDEQPGNELTLGSATAGVVLAGGASVHAEVALSSGRDSTGVATRVEAHLPLFDDRLSIEASVSRIGEEFRNPSNVGLRAGTREITGRAAWTTDDTQLRASWESQELPTRELERSRAILGLEQSLSETVGMTVEVSRDRSGQRDSTATAGAARVGIAWQAASRLKLTAEARDELWRTGELASPGSELSLGAAYDLSEKVALELAQRWVRPGGTDDGYSVTHLGVTSELGADTRAWASYQLAGTVSGPVNAAVVGLDHEFTLGDDWRVQAMAERRESVGRAAPGDPILAAPFQTQEEDYLSLGLGLEYLPVDAEYRLSARGETKMGSESDTHLLTVAGDVALGADLGILTRQEYRERRTHLTGAGRYSRDRRSLWGLAWRPASTNTFNVLAKLEWRDAINPFGASLIRGLGEEERLIGAVEALWTPDRALEVGGRFAMRSSATRQELASGPVELESEARFIGGHARWMPFERVGGKLTARGLYDGAGQGVWDVAPALLLHPLGGLEVEAGYRFGELEDPDFAVRSGEGWYVSVGLKVTEALVPSAVAFWRDRIGG